MKKILLSVSSAVLFAGPATLSAVTVWVETGDAGDALATTQQTAGLGALTMISGTLPTGSDVDIYQISIPTPVLFKAWLNGMVMADPDLWLFNSAGFGVVHNDIVSAGETNLTAAFVLTPGIYYLAITNDLAEAHSSSGAIWIPDYDYNGARAPDGMGAAQSFIGWNGPMLNNNRNYEIYLEGAEFSVIPEPSTLSLLAIGCLLVSRRRVIR